MYAPFFGLSKEPFSIAPDPRFLFMSEQHREALAHLLYGLDGGGGFVLLTGEIGAGKTTVCRCFLEQVPAHCDVAYVFNPKLTAIELLQTVCGEFGIPLPADASSVKAHVDALNAFLLQSHAQGRQAVLVIDEAQSLGADVLEQLRLLTNLETAERKLLQIVLIGQPELRAMLARPELEQLGQRVIARYHLGALTVGETQQYIRHRLAVAGPAAALPFDAAALVRIHRLSGGVPRRINLLADRALLGAYAQGKAQADRQTVAQAAREVFGGLSPAAPWPARVLAPGWPGAALLLAALLLAAGAGAGGSWWWAHAGRGPAGAAPGGPGATARVAGPASATLLARASPPAAAPLPAASLAAALAASQAPVSASASASGPNAPSNPAAKPTASDPAALLQAAAADPATPLRELALRWNVSIGEGDPCTAALQAALACFRSSQGGLALLRQLGRPALLVLHRSDGVPVYALLTGLDFSRASLQVGRQDFALSLPALARAWRGEFVTFWRTPAGWHEGADLAQAPLGRAWIDQQLASAGFDARTPLRERVWAFQLAQGLAPDGLAGPITLMRLNHVARVSEPVLQGEG
jgi:general secretion pathway protein A